MDWFKNYVENIAITLILTSFAGVIMPNGKYREYVRLVMGLAVILAVISPVAGILSKGTTFEDLYSQAERKLNMGVVNIEKTSYETELLTAIMEDYKKGLKTQMAEKISALGYRLVDADMEIDASDDNFGSITNLRLVLEADSIKGTQLIKVDKISVGSNDSRITQDTTVTESKEVKELKNFLSSFYNLSTDNIHVTMSN